MHNGIAAVDLELETLRHQLSTLECMIRSNRTDIQASASGESLGDASGYDISHTLQQSGDEEAQRLKGREAGQNDLGRSMMRDVDDLRAAILAHTCVRNNMTTTARLPPELLAKVFEAARSEESQRWKVQSTISLVCSHWRSVAISDPFVWSTVRMSMKAPVAWVNEVLARSGSLPLDATLNLDPPGSSTVVASSSPPPTVLAELLFAHVHRVRALEIQGSINLINPSLSHMCGKAPLLKCINLQCMFGSDSPMLILDAIQEMEAPQLTKLILGRGQCNPTGNILPSSIVELSIEIDPRSEFGRTTLAHFSTFCSNNPQLLRLHLPHAGFSSGNDIGREPTFHQIHLGNIEELTITNDDTCLAYILRLIHGPKLNALHIRCIAPPRPDYFPSVERVFLGLRSFLQRHTWLGGLDQMEIVPGSTWSSVSLTNQSRPKPIITILAYHGKRFRMFLDSLHTLVPPQLPSLSIKSMESNSPGNQEQWNGFFYALMTVTTVTLDMENPAMFLRCFYDPISTYIPLRTLVVRNADMSRGVNIDARTSFEQLPFLEIPVANTESHQEGIFSVGTLLFFVLRCRRQAGAVLCTLHLQGCSAILPRTLDALREVVDVRVSDMSEMDQ